MSPSQPPTGTSKVRSRLDGEFLRKAADMPKAADDGEYAGDTSIQRRKSSRTRCPVRLSGWRSTNTWITQPTAVMTHEAAKKTMALPQFDRRTVQQIESGSNRLLLLFKLFGIARRVFDAVEERTRTPLRMGIQQMIESGPWFGHYQVGKFVQDHVVDDVLRHP